MLDRYTLATSTQAICEYFEVSEAPEIRKTYCASPAQQLPIIHLRKTNKIELYQWGFISGFANNKSLSPKLFNLPLSALKSKPMHRKKLATSRCLILADGFYTQKQISKKQSTTYYCHRVDNQPFAIAGICEEYEDISNQLIRCFNMITVQATDPLDQFQDDAPSILDQDLSKKWLDSYLSQEDLLAILEVKSKMAFTYHPVKPILIHPKVDNASLITPTQPADQFGNYTLF